MRYILTIIIIAISPLVSFGEVPVIEKGFDAYLNDGPESAVTIWLAGSILAESERTITHYKSRFAELEAAIGELESYDLIGTITLSERVKILYYVAYFEKAPYFARFRVYERNSEWVVSTLNFDSDPEDILPCPMDQLDR